MYCEECLDGRIPEVMIVVETGNNSKVYRCLNCGKRVTLVVAQDIVENAS